MSIAFGAFGRSALGAFKESPLGARSRGFSGLGEALVGYKAAPAIVPVGSIDSLDGSPASNDFVITIGGDSVSVPGNTSTSQTAQDLRDACNASAAATFSAFAWAGTGDEIIALELEGFDLPLTGLGAASLTVTGGGSGSVTDFEERDLCPDHRAFEFGIHYNSGPWEEGWLQRFEDVDGMVLDFRTGTTDEVYDPDITCAAATIRYRTNARTDDRRFMMYYPMVNEPLTGDNIDWRDSLGDWTDDSDGASSVSFGPDGLTFNVVGGDTARARIVRTVPGEIDAETLYLLRAATDTGSISIRIGTTAGGQEIVTESVVGSVYMQAFTSPSATDDLHIELKSTTNGSVAPYLALFFKENFTTSSGGAFINEAGGTVLITAP